VCSCINDTFALTQSIESATTASPFSLPMFEKGVKGMLALGKMHKVTSVHVPMFDKRVPGVHVWRV
jgi:hypothetical protein